MLADRKFVYLGMLFEAGLVGLALGLAWLVGVDASARMAWDPPAILWGLGGAVPIFGLFLLSQRFPVGPLRPIKQFLVELLGPYLAACRWYELLLLALLAGSCEELLFRGVLQAWLERWGTAAGVIGCNILFGLAHWITPMYALLAGIVGVYLSWLLEVRGEPNLVIPSVTHAVYDLLAFLVVVREYRREEAFPSDIPPEAERQSEDPPL